MRSYALSCVISFLLPTLSSCASTPFYNMPKTQQTLSGAMKDADTAIERSTSDYKEKKLLVDNLARSKVPGSQQQDFALKERELRGLLNRMQTNLADIAKSRKKMSDANSEIVAIGYSHSDVKSDQPEYPQVRSSIEDFQAAAGEVNALIEAYSMASNSFTGLVEKNKLLIKFEPADFVKRVQGSVSKAQETSASMQTELQSVEQSLDQPKQGKVKRAMQRLNSEVHGLAETYNRKAQRYQGIAHQIREVTADARITSLDPEWPKVQKLVNEFEGIDQELAQLQTRFFTEIETLKKQSNVGARD